MADRCAKDEATRNESRDIKTSERKERGHHQIEAGQHQHVLYQGPGKRGGEQGVGKAYRTTKQGERLSYPQRALRNIPKITKDLQRAPKELASRFFQLASGHAMIAPFLKEKFGWIETDICWWCGTGRQTRGHLFGECLTWKEEIKKLWKEVGGATSSGRAVPGRSQ